MSYELSYSERGFVVHFRGRVTIDELNEANGKIHGHPQFDYHRYQIIDLLEADLSSVTEEDAAMPAAIDGVASDFRWGVKVALVAQESIALSAANAYVEEARAMAPRWEFGVFPTREDALKWARG